MKRRAVSRRGNIPTVYNGRRYASKAEAAHAIHLDSLLSHGLIRAWKPQVRIPLVVNGRTVGRHDVDFLVEDCNGIVEYHEVKGIVDPRDVVFRLWNLKAQIVRSMYPDINYRVITANGAYLLD